MIPRLFLLAIVYRSPLTEAQACAAGSAKQIKGNWYCSQVDAINYRNFPGHGTYNKITRMDPKTGTCDHEVFQYSGSLSPLNEELSIHVRGPTWLKKVAVYASSKSAYVQPRGVGGAHSNGARRQKHKSLHPHPKNLRLLARDDVIQRRIGQLVHATIDGKLASWTNEYDGLSTANLAQSKGPASFFHPTQTSDYADRPSVTSKAQPVASSLVSTTEITDDAGDSWVLEGHYDAAGGIMNGLTFLNHFGGTKNIPGTAEGGPAFGASLSYASSNGKSGAASPEVLQDAVLEDNVEIVIMSDRSCENDDCGYVRPGGVSYHGFGGSHKVFLIEFSMPTTGKSTFNGDMPSIWLLNAQIPLTSQYGTNGNCSCWKSGCGEFDIFEVLDHGSHRCKSTLHMKPAGGSSDWFMRPMDEPITIAVVFGGEEKGVLVRVLQGSQDFAPILENGLVESWMEGECSLFRLGS